jgi:hypothetical protein
MLDVMFDADIADRADANPAPNRLPGLHSRTSGRISAAGR